MRRTAQPRAYLLPAPALAASAGSTGLYGHLPATAVFLRPAGTVSVAQPATRGILRAAQWPADFAIPANPAASAARSDPPGRFPAAWRPPPLREIPFQV